MRVERNGHGTPGLAADLVPTLLVCAGLAAGCDIWSALGGGEGLPCENDRACPAHTSCLLGRCLSCQSDGDCPAGRHCNAGSCRVFDAGVTDARLADGRRPDSGPDATTPADASAFDVAPDAAADATSDGNAGVDRYSTDAATDAAARDGTVLVPAPCTFDAGSLDVPFAFGPALTKRLTGVVDGGPLHVAPLLQAIDEGACSRGDALFVDLGLRVGGTFFDHFDSAQGTIVFWATPEWNIEDIADATRYFLRAGDFGFGVDGPTQGAFVQLGSARFVFPGAFASWTAGATHFVALRWDVRSGFLDGWHIGLQVDQTGWTALGMAVPPPAVDTPLVVGAFDQTGLGAIGAFIEGLTIYRRPLTDPNGGIDVGRSDEILDLFNFGRGAVPTSITGSWDVVFALPTDADNTVLAMPSDVSQAFGHPFHRNLLGEAGYLITTAQFAEWSATGGAVTVVEATEPIFGGGARVTTASANEGIGIDFNSGSSSALVVRALVHSDGTSIVRLQLQVPTGTLFHLDGTRQSDRDHPDVLIGTAQVATGTTLHLELINGSSGNSSFHVHQVEVLPNLLTNPSFENGNQAVRPWLPTGWYNVSTGSLDTRRESAIAHSGAVSLGLVNAGTTNYAAIRTLEEPAGFGTRGDFYAVGGFFYLVSGAAPRIYPDNGCLVALSGPIVDSSDKFVARAAPITGTWQHVTAVGRRHARITDGAINCMNNLLYFGGTWGASMDVLVDDAYIVQLDRVPLSVVPAELAHALSSDALRVDGDDVAVQPVTALTVTRGSLSIRIGRPHPSGTDDLFCPYSHVLFELGEFNGDHITLRSQDNGSVRFDADIGMVSCDSVLTSDILGAGQVHRFDVAYASSGALTLTIDGNMWISCPLNGAAWAEVPPAIVLGDSNRGNEQCDILVGREGAVFGAQ